MSAGLGGALAAFTEKLYVFSYDYTNKDANIKGLVQYIADARAISSWSYLLPGTILLRSYLTAHQLTDALRAFIGDARCLVVEVNKANLSGWLPKAAWDWLDPPATNALFGSLIPPQFKKE